MGSMLAGVRDYFCRVATRHDPASLSRDPGVRRARRLGLRRDALGGGVAASQHGVSRGEAWAQTRNARFLAEFSLVAKTFAAGQLSPVKVDMLARLAAGKYAELFARDEAFLVDLAVGSMAPPPQHPRRRLHRHPPIRRATSLETTRRHHAPATQVCRLEPQLNPGSGRFRGPRTCRW
jgi:hypothetical protein